MHSVILEMFNLGFNYFRFSIRQVVNWLYIAYYVALTWNSYHINQKKISTAANWRIKSMCLSIILSPAQFRHVRCLSFSSSSNQLFTLLTNKNSLNLWGSKGRAWGGRSWLLELQLWWSWRWLYMRWIRWLVVYRKMLDAYLNYFELPLYLVKK